MLYMGDGGTQQVLNIFRLFWIIFYSIPFYASQKENEKSQTRHEDAELQGRSTEGICLEFINQVLL